MFFISLILLFIQTYTNIWSAFVGTGGKAPFYPAKAVVYLRENLPQGNIFSDYGWGGFLIWQLPQKKVFVDGRMPSWRFNPPNLFESPSAYDEYLKIVNWEIPYQDAFKKYDIDTVLFPTKESSLTNLLEEKLRNLETKLGKDKKDYNFIEEIKKDGWLEVYRDRTAVILKKG
jgi:hypothetical protein